MQMGEMLLSILDGLTAEGHASIEGLFLAHPDNWVDVLDAVQQRIAAIKNKIIWPE